MQAMNQTIRNGKCKTLLITMNIKIHLNIKQLNLHYSSAALYSVKIMTHCVNAVFKDSETEEN